MRSKLAVLAVAAALSGQAYATDPIIDPLFFPNLAPPAPFTCLEEIKTPGSLDGPGVSWIGPAIAVTFGVPTPNTMTVQAGDFNLNLHFTSQVGNEVLRYDDPTYRDGLMAVFDIRGGGARVIYVMINAQKWRCQRA